MNASSHPFEEPGQTSRTLDPCILVIFGATGDLTAKKLMPAIYNLKREGQLPTNFVCCGFARREKKQAVQSLQVVQIDGEDGCVSEGTGNVSLDVASAERIA